MNHRHTTSLSARADAFKVGLEKNPARRATLRSREKKRQDDSPHFSQITGNFRLPVPASLKNAMRPQS
jgi:hypothetical protein